jgi:hypothetical protein
VQKEPKEDSGLRGVQARDKAFADILNGEDCKTKKWLESYLNKTLKTVKKAKEQPQVIGAILDDDIPF